MDGHLGISSLVVCGPWHNRSDAKQYICANFES